MARRIHYRNLSLLLIVCVLTLGTCAVLGAVATEAAVTAISG